MNLGVTVLAPGRLVAGLAGAAQLAAGFLAWSATGAVGLDLLAAGPTTVALSLVVLAGLPLVAMLVGDHGWPRLVSGTLTAFLVLDHLAHGPDGVATNGVLLAVAGAMGHWLAAALAAGPVKVPRFVSW
ncbi:MAG: hypothetical protein ACI867_000460 [Glaciecola sp.]